MEKPEASLESGQQTDAGKQAQEAGIKSLEQKYKDYENQKELVKDDNPYRYY